MTTATAKHPKSNAPAVYISRREAAKLFGMREGVRFVSKAVKLGVVVNGTRIYLRHQRIGNRMLFKPEWIDEFLEANNRAAGVAPQEAQPANIDEVFAAMKNSLKRRIGADSPKPRRSGSQPRVGEPRGRDDGRAEEKGGQPAGEATSGKS